MTQAIVLGLVEQWGYDGFEIFTRNVSDIYRTKRDIFDRALREHLGDFAEWTKPESGMFFWYVHPSDPLESSIFTLVFIDRTDSNE